MTADQRERPDQRRRQRHGRTGPIDPTSRDGVVMLAGSALAFGVLALVGEVLLFAALGQLLHWVVGGGWLGIFVAAVGLVIAAGAWGLWMAPKARRRLRVLTRVIICAVVGVALGALLSAAGWPRFGVAVIVAGLLVAGIQWVSALREGVPVEEAA